MAAVAPVKQHVNRVVDVAVATDYLAHLKTACHARFRRAPTIITRRQQQPQYPRTCYLSYIRLPNNHEYRSREAYETIRETENALAAEVLRDEHDFVVDADRAFVLAERFVAHLRPARAQ